MDPERVEAAPMIELEMVCACLKLKWMVDALPDTMESVGTSASTVTAGQGGL